MKTNWLTSEVSVKRNTDKGFDIKKSSIHELKGNRILLFCYNSSHSSYFMEHKETKEKQLFHPKNVIFSPPVCELSSSIFEQVSLRIDFDPSSLLWLLLQLLIVEGGFLSSFVQTAERWGHQKSNLKGQLTIRSKCNFQRKEVSLQWD